MSALRVGFITEQQDPQKGGWILALRDHILNENEIVAIYYTHDHSVIVKGLTDKTETILLTMNNDSNITERANAVNIQGPFYLKLELVGRSDAVKIVNDELQLSGNDSVIPVDHSPSDNVQNLIQNNNSGCCLNYYNYLTNNSNNVVFHNTIHQNIVLLDRMAICCVDNLLKNSAYAFLNTQITRGDALIFKIMNREYSSKSSFIFGLTTVNPTTMKPRSFPEDINAFQQVYPQGEWLYSIFDQSFSFELYDEIALYLNLENRLCISKNNCLPMQLVFDTASPKQNVSYWPFFNLNGQITALKIICKTSVQNLKLAKTPVASKNTELVLCPFCCERLCDAVLEPCGCSEICFECATIIKKSSRTAADCPYDRLPICNIRKKS
ncbi:unnamed protein product [Didymodactylos carnosus]|nr:unnamed protein product [Didymodactylos carnosus]CAF4335883.1 unnamed protein product [Didymodactylos carnosus]